LASDKGNQVKKWIYLGLITVVLVGINFLFNKELNLHDSFLVIVSFFAVQTFVLFRIDYWVPEEWSMQVSLAKIIIRLLSSLIFILVLMYTQDDLFNMVIQFIAVYLVYMIFEIGSALTNLRRN